MRILVTGGAGFIGSHVVDRMLEAGHEVGVLDNLSTGRRENVPPNVPLFVVDVRDRDATHRVFTEFRPEAVCHQAAQASVPKSIRDPLLDADVNLTGSIHLLDACTAPGARVERFVFGSTGGAICGEVPEPIKASEAGPIAPQSPYAIHKLAVEQLLRVYEKHRGLSATVLRYANVYGPRQDPHGEAGVIAIFMSSVLAGQAIRVNAWHVQGDDGCLRDYVFVSDVARANALALSGKIPEPMLNVATGEPTSTRALAAAIMRVSGRTVSVEDGPPRIGDVGRSVLDPTLGKRHLGEPVTLERGLAETFAWYQTR